MSQFKRATLFMLLIVATITTCLAQSDATKTQKKVPANEVRQQPSRTDGLKKMTNNANRSVDIHIDEEALEESIDLSIEKAMQSVEIALEKMEINLDAIEIHLNELNMNLEPMEITIPDLDINIEPVDIDFDHFGRDNDREQDEDDNEEEERITDEEEMHKESNSTMRTTTQEGKDQVKDQSGKRAKSEKDKTTKEKKKAIKNPN